MLYELITGHSPFTGNFAVAVAFQHLWEDPIPPSPLNFDVLPEWDAVVLKAMSKKPASHYQFAADMRSNLIRVISGQAVIGERKQATKSPVGPQKRDSS